MGNVEVSENISIPEDEIVLEFVRAGGPGGQKVNKTSSAVMLKFDVEGSESLPDDVRSRLIRLAGNRLSSEGILVLRSRIHRSQHMNRQAVLRKFIRLVQRAERKPKHRKATRPTGASRERRLKEKKKRGKLKRERRYRPSREDLD